MTDQPRWAELISSARAGAKEMTAALDELARLRDDATAEISKYLRAEAGVDLDIDAIKSTLTRPYTLIPINENEATLIHWRGVRMPLFGWVVKQEPSFTISRVSRGMGLLTPFPQWMKDELGWKPPQHSAVIDGSHTQIKVTSGDEATFKRKYGKHLGAGVGMGTGIYRIKAGDAWIRLISELIKDGILPYAATPLAKGDWNAKATTKIELREYQEPFIQEFRSKGAVFFNLPPGAGKTMLSLFIVAHLTGKVLILAPSIILCEQWHERVKEYAPEANVTILTYASGRKAIKDEWGLVVFDEVQTLPADTFSKLAFLKTKYRIGLSASPWREDGRQYMITALSGFPCAIRWADLIRAGVLKRPRVVIATVQNDASKTAFTRQLIEKRKAGRALIFCDYLQAGEELADALDVPFVSGTTSRKLEKVTDAEVCVVSRIGDRGLDFPDLTLVIEWAFMGKSREQEAQRLGRLLHGQARGEHYLLFTPQEAEKFKPRIFGIESELAGEIDLEFITVGKIAEKHERAIVIHAARGRGQKRPDVSARAAEPEPTDDIAKVMALRPIAVKITEAERLVGASTRPYLRRVFRYCFSAPLSPREIADGLGITGSVARSRISSSCKALDKVGLMEYSVAGEKHRYIVVQDEIKRAKALASILR